MNKKNMSPLKAIRLYCLGCSGTSSEVTKCTVTRCELYPFRLGKNPNIKREYTDEQREAMRERFKTAREAKNAFNTQGN